VSTLTRTDPGRSERDALERLQQELREVRRQRETLPGENAKLASQVERLEREVRSLRRTLAVARGEWEQPAPSLPERLVPPFQANPSRRTAYGRVRYALRAMVPPLLPFTYMGGQMLPSFTHFLLFFGGAGLFSFGLFFLFQGHEDDDGSQGWSFDEEGLSPVSLALGSGKVLYPELRKVEVKQGWLERLFGFGTVRVTWTPTVPTSLGKAVGYPNRIIKIELLDDPKRLAAWLRERMPQASTGQQGGARVG
jgi:hypothetical protein